MSKKFLLISVLLCALPVLSGCQKGDLPPEKQIDYEKDVKPLIETTEKGRVRGSCNVIATKSSCVDFIGEVFTEDRMKLSCAEGKFSLDACPYSDLGGCQATPGTVSESIAWSYSTGGQPITAEEAGYQAKACNALPASKWVKPADLLNE